MKTINNITLEDAYQAALTYLEYKTPVEYDFCEHKTPMLYDGYEYNVKNYFKFQLYPVYLFLSKHEVFKDIIYDKQTSEEDICRMVTYLYRLTQEW